MADSSPKWKRPSDIMKMRKKRKPVRPNHAATSSDISISQVNSSSKLGRSPCLKRRNPFGCSPRKRAHLYKLTETDKNAAGTETGDDAASALFHILDNVDVKVIMKAMHGFN